MTADCVFCRILAGTEPATFAYTYPETVAILPRHPVTEGHLLVIPREHVTDAAAYPYVTGLTFQRAAEIAANRGGQFNLITSCGSDATQTVFHLHVHIVPRRAGDGLALPWTGQKKGDGRCLTSV